MGRTRLVVVCVALAAASVAGTTAVIAQGRGGRDAQPRDFERPSRIVIDGFGASIGATVRDVSPEEGQRAKLSPPEGAYVTGVQPGSPAEKAGVAAGDIIVEFDGERVRSARQLSRLVRESADDRMVKSVVVREGSRRTIEITPDRDRSAAAQPDFGRLEQQLRDLAQRFDFRFDGRNAPFGPAFGARGRLGVVLMPIGDQLATYFGVQRGVLVSSVENDSPAGRAGLKAGDVITAVNGRSVDDVSDVVAEIGRANAGASVSLTVMRDRKEMKLTATMPDASRPRRPERGASRRSI